MLYATNRVLIGLFLSLDRGQISRRPRNHNICCSNRTNQLLGEGSSNSYLCTASSTICVPSATRHNIHMYPYFLFAAIQHLKSSPTFSARPCSSVGRVTVDLFRRSWVRFPPRSKDFFFASCGSLFPFTRANAQWVIHGFK